MLTDQLELPSVLRVKEGVQKLGINTYEFKQAPSDYYTWELEQRREFLGAKSVDHLCKSLIIENKKCRDEQRPHNSRYFSHNAFKFIKGLNTLPKSAFHLHFASNEESEKLTGFEFNAVAPFGMLTDDIPIIISDKILQLEDDFIWVSELVAQAGEGKGIYVAPVTK